MQFETLENFLPLYSGDTSVSNPVLKVCIPFWQLVAFVITAMTNVPECFKR